MQLPLASAFRGNNPAALPAFTKKKVGTDLEFQLLSGYVHSATGNVRFF